jgi:hypothetical protein
LIPFGAASVAFSIALIVGSGQIKTDTDNTFGESTMGVVAVFFMLTLIAAFFLAMGLSFVRNALLRAPASTIQIDKLGAILWRFRLPRFCLHTTPHCS